MIPVKAMYMRILGITLVSAALLGVVYGDTNYAPQTLALAARTQPCSKSYLTCFRVDVTPGVCRPNPTAYGDYGWQYGDYWPTDYLESNCEPTYIPQDVRLMIDATALYTGGILPSVNGLSCSIVAGPLNMSWFSCPVKGLNNTRPSTLVVDGISPLVEGTTTTQITLYSVSSAVDIGNPGTPAQITPTLSLSFAASFGCLNCTNGFCNRTGLCDCQPGFRGPTCSLSVSCTSNGTALPSSYLCADIVGNWSRVANNKDAVAEQETRRLYSLAQSVTSCPVCLLAVKNFLCQRYYPSCGGGQGRAVCRPACAQISNSCGSINLFNLMQLNLTCSEFGATGCINANITFSGSCDLSNCPTGSNGFPCSLRGACDASSRICTCQPGFYGANCGIRFISPTPSSVPSGLPPVMVGGGFSTVSRDASGAYLAAYDTATANTWYIPAPDGSSRFDARPNKPIAAGVWVGQDLYVAGPIGTMYARDMLSEPWAIQGKDIFLFRYRLGQWTRLPVYASGSYISQISYFNGAILMVGRFFTVNDQEPEDGPNVGYFNLTTNTWGTFSPNGGPVSLPGVRGPAFNITGYFTGAVSNATHMLLAGDFEMNCVNPSGDPAPRYLFFVELATNKWTAPGTQTSALSCAGTSVISGPIYAIAYVQTNTTTIAIFAGLFKTANGLQRGGSRMVMYDMRAGVWLGMGQQSIPSGYVIRVIEPAPALQYIFISGTFPGARTLVRWTNGASGTFTNIDGMYGAATSMKLIGTNLYVAGSLTACLSGCPRIGLAIYRNALTPTSAYWDLNPPTINGGQGNFTMILPVPGTSHVLFGGDFTAVGDAAVSTASATTPAYLTAIWNAERFVDAGGAPYDSNSMTEPWFYYHDTLSAIIRPYVGSLTNVQGLLYAAGSFVDRLTSSARTIATFNTNTLTWNSPFTLDSNRGSRATSYWATGSTSVVTYAQLNPASPIAGVGIVDYAASNGGYFLRPVVYSFPYNVSLSIAATFAGHGTYTLGIDTYAFGRFADLRDESFYSGVFIIRNVSNPVTPTFPVDIPSGNGGKVSGCAPFIRTMTNDSTYLYFGGNIHFCNPQVPVANAVRLHRTTKQWSNMTTTGIPGGYVHVMLFDPVSRDIYVGGRFTDPTLTMNNVRIYRPSTNAWVAMSNGVDGDVLAMQIIGGSLYIGGRFTATSYDRVILNGLARWDGTAWRPVHTGAFNDGIFSIAALPRPQTGAYPPNCNASFSIPPKLWAAGTPVTGVISMRDFWSRPSTNAPGFAVAVLTQIPALIANVSYTDQSASQSRMLFSFIPIRTTAQTKFSLTLNNTALLDHPLTMTIASGPVQAANSYCLVFNASVAGITTAIRCVLQDGLGNNRTSSDILNVTVVHAGQVVSNFVTAYTGNGAYVTATQLTETGDYAVTACVGINPCIPLGYGSYFVFTVFPPSLSPGNSLIVGVPSTMVAGVTVVANVSTLDQYSNPIDGEAPNYYLHRFNLSFVVTSTGVTLPIIPPDISLARVDFGFYQVTLTGYRKAGMRLKIGVDGQLLGPAQNGGMSVNIAPADTTSALVSRVSVTTGSIVATAAETGFVVRAMDAYGNGMITNSDTFTASATNANKNITGVVSKNLTACRSLEKEPDTNGYYCLSMVLIQSGIFDVAVYLTSGASTGLLSGATSQLIVVPQPTTDVTQTTLAGADLLFAGFLSRPIIELRDQFSNVQLASDTATTRVNATITNSTGHVIFARDAVIDPSQLFSRYVMAFYYNLTGNLSANVDVNGVRLPQSPFTLRIRPGAISPQASFVNGSGIISALANEAASFIIFPRDALGNAVTPSDVVGGSLSQQFIVTLGNGQGAAQILSKTDCVVPSGREYEDGMSMVTAVCVTFLATKGGILAVSIVVTGANEGLDGSPFRVTIYGNCAQGSYSPSVVDECRLCPPASYAANLGQTVCTSCPTATTSAVGATDIVNCSCSAGYYTPSLLTGVDCLPCPPGAVCEGVIAQPRSAPGFFASDGVYLQCAPVYACTGFDQCAEGYTGHVCGACTEGYYRSAGECFPCGSTGPGRLAGYVIMSILFAVLLVWLQTPRQGITLSVLYIAFNAAQIGGLNGQIALNWPPNTLNFFNVLSFFDFNLELVAPECSLFPSTNAFVSRWFAQLLLPVYFGVLMLLILLVMVIWIAVARKFGTRIVDRHPYWFEPGETTGERIRYVVCDLGRVGKRTYKDAAWLVGGAMLNLLVLMYLPNFYYTFSYLDCFAAGDNLSVVRLDRTVTCFTSEYNARLPALIVAAIVYLFVVPAVCAYVLFRQRRKDDNDIIDRDRSFLVLRYTATMYFWELAVLARRALLALAILFFTSDPMMRAGAALVVLFVAEMLHYRYGAFAEPRFNPVETVSLTCAGVVYLWGIFFNSRAATYDWVADLMIILTMTVNIMLVTVVAVLAVRRWFKTPVAKAAPTLRRNSSSQVEFVKSGDTDLTAINPIFDGIGEL